MTAWDPPWEWQAEVRRGRRFGYLVTFVYGLTREYLTPFRLTAGGAARCARRGVVKRQRAEARTERRWVIRA